MPSLALIVGRVLPEGVGGEGNSRPEVWLVAQFFLLVCIWFVLRIAIGVLYCFVDSAPLTGGRSDHRSVADGVGGGGVKSLMGLRRKPTA